jgi:hypothetical protein
MIDLYDRVGTWSRGRATRGMSEGLWNPTTIGTHNPKVGGSYPPSATDPGCTDPVCTSRPSATGGHCDSVPSYCAVLAAERNQMAQTTASHLIHPRA